MKVRCLIVEDHLMFMQLIRTMLGGLRHLEIVGMARTVADAIRLCEEKLPDLLLLDLALPDGGGLEVAKRLVTLKPDARIIVLTGQMEAFVCPADLRPSIIDLIDKAGAFEDVETSIKKYVQDVRMRQNRPADGSFRKPHHRALSRRENQVFSMIGAGMISKEIAAELGLSVQTIHVFRRRIAEKMGISGGEVTREAIRQHQAGLGRSRVRG